MVVSQYNPSVQYAESKRVHPRDMHLESKVYRMELLGVPVLVTPGRVQYDHAEDHHLLYVTIYLVQSSTSVVPIGICECPVAKRAHWLTEDASTVQLERCESPRLFSFVTRDFLWSMRKPPPPPPSSAGSSSSSVDVLVQYEPGVRGYYQLGDAARPSFEQTVGALLPPVLKEERRGDAQRIRDAFVEGGPQEHWIQLFFQNAYFQLVPNEGGPDAWLACLRDAFSSIGFQTTVPTLRTLLANQVSVHEWEQWRDTYQRLHHAALKEDAAVKHWRDTHQALKQQFLHSVQTAQKAVLIKQATAVQRAHRAAQVALRWTQRLLRPWRFMKSVQSLDQLRAAVRKGVGVVLPWMIEAMERVLEVKCVFFHAEAYYQQDWKHVVQTGPSWSQRARFVPRYYAMVEVNRDAYRLVRYKSKQLFVRRELPWDVRRILADKVREEQGGGFAWIPEWVSEPDPRDDELEEEDDNLQWLGIYRDDIHLVFYHKSLADPYPGQGPGEQLLPARLLDMKPLAQLHGWRQRLSSFWVQPFALDQHYWSSVEHYVQANRFVKHHPDFYLQFTVESGSPLSKDPSMAKAAGSASGMWHGEERLRPADMEPDPDYVTHRYLPCLQKALWAKFTQHPDLRAILLATRDAKLLQYRQAKRPHLCIELMKLRYRLQTP